MSKSNAGASAKRRMVGLDLLRFVAILLVLGRHLGEVGSVPDDWPNAAKTIVAAWERGGWIGVDLFFVLSGFLVSGLLFAEYKTRGRLSIIRFYTRRGWKIYPPFIVLIATTVLVLWMGDLPIGPARLAAELLFLQSYFPGLWNHTWSLAVEEHFYLSLPLVLLGILRCNRSAPNPLKPVVGLAAAVAILALTARILNWYCRSEYTHMTHLFASHLRFDSLFFGVAISYVYHFHTDRFIATVRPWRRHLVALGILLLAPALFLTLETASFVYTVGFSVFCLGSGMLLVGVLLCDLSRHRLFDLPAAIGVYSYSIYLWHMPVIAWVVPSLERAVDVDFGFTLRAAVYLGGALGLGVMMSKAIELPALRLRDRWFPPRATGPIESVPNQ